jgi:hypothetical protein
MREDYKRNKTKTACSFLKNKYICSRFAELERK